MDRFIDTLVQNAANVLTLAVVVGGAASLILFVRARNRHVRRLRAEIQRQVPLSGRIQEALSQIFNASSAELTTVGAVTFADIAWQYSLADPTIWDHFQGPAADHVADAIQNLDVLRASLGEHSTQLFTNLVEALKNIEATQVFNDLAERLPLLESAGAGTAMAVEASSHSLVDSLANAGATTGDAKISALDAATSAGDSGLIHHLPLITIGFATYRMWRRHQKGTSMARNLEFAGIEVATRAGGGLIGGQIGGIIGTAVAPGLGTILGGVAGAVAGTLGGMLLGEDIKKRHVRKAKEQFDTSLALLGRTYLQDPVKFRQLTNVFEAQEIEYVKNLNATKFRLRQHAMPWRVAWPDQKLILLEETVKLAERRLDGIKQGTIDAVDRLTYMRETDQDQELGIILWSNPALREQVTPDAGLIDSLEETNDKLRQELVHLQGPVGQGAAA